MGIVPTPETDRARFWAKVDKNGPVPERCPERGPCWLWTAALYTNGYGAFRLGGKQRKAHVVAYEWLIGPLTAQACHRCDIKRCVNPAHLFDGTQKDNIRDMFAKGRQRERRGEVSNFAILTEAQVSEIRGLYEQGVFQRDIAAQYGISQTGVSLIVRYARWQHVE